jgi:hypothetical protein
MRSMVSRSMLLLMTVAALSLATTAKADHRSRVAWTYEARDGGVFENTRGLNWTETAYTGGGAKYYFREVARTDHYVEIYDAARDCRIRLYSHHSTIRWQGAPWAELYTGSWR